MVVSKSLRRGYEVNDNRRGLTVTPGARCGFAGDTGTAGVGGNTLISRRDDEVEREPVLGSETSICFIEYDERFALSILERERERERRPRPVTWEVRMPHGLSHPSQAPSPHVQMYRRLSASQMNIIWISIA